MYSAESNELVFYGLPYLGVLKTFKLRTRFSQVLASAESSLLICRAEEVGYSLFSISSSFK